MANDLISLLLSAQISDKSVANIQEQIKKISDSTKNNPIKIDVKINEDALKQIQNLSKTIASSTNSPKLNIDTSQAEKGLQRITKHFKQGEAEASSMTKTTVAGFEKTVEVLNRVNGTFKESVRKDITTDYEKERKSIEAIESARLKSIARRKEEEAKANLAQSKAINDVINNTYKLQQAEEKRFAKLLQNVDNYKQKMLGGDGFSGELDIFADKQKGKFDEKALAKIRADVEGLNMNTPDLNNKMKQLGLQFNSLKLSASQSGSIITRTMENMGKFMRYYLAGGMLVGFVNAMKNGVKSVVELDTSLTELAKVSDLTSTQLAEFTDKAYDAGKTIGRTGKEIIDATSEFRRAGYEIESAFDLSQQALLLTNIGDGIDSVKDASSSLIAILKGFRMEAEETAHVVDALNEVSNNYAIDTNNLTEILERTSGTIGQTGTSYEELLGLATGGFESLRSAEMVASGINMISQRLRGMEEDGSRVEGLIPKIQEAFDEYTNGAVSVIDKQNGGLHSTYEILQQLSQVYPTLSDEAKAYLNEAVAGNRQNKVLVAILDNWKNVENATISATDSLNSANIENEKYLNSIQGKLAQLSSSAELFWYNMINSDTIKVAVDGLTTLVNIMDKLVNNEISSFIAQTALLSTSLILLDKGFKILGKTTMGTALQLFALDVAQKGLIATTKGLTTALLASPLFWVVVGSTAIVGIIKLVDELNISFKEQQEIVQTLSSDINTLQSEYDQLSANKNRTAEQERYLKLLEKELEYKQQLLKQETKTAIDKYFEGTSTTGVDGKTYSFNNSQADKIREQIAEVQELQKEYVRLESSLANVYDEETAKKFDETNKDILELKTSLIESQRPMQEWVEILGEDAPVELKNLITEIERLMYTEEEWIDLNKWMVAEEIANQVAIGQTAERMAEMERTLISLGFTSDDVANILGGNIDFVKDKYKELDMQQIINLQTIETLDATQKQTWINYLNNSKTATQQLIADTKARIQAIMAEAQALAALTGGKVNASVVSKKGEIDPKTGLFSNLATQAQNQAIDAQRELVNLEGNLRQIEKALTNVSNIKVTSGGIGEGKGGGSTKDQYSAESDRYQKLNLELDRNNVLLAKNKTLQELAGDDLAKKLPLMEEEIELNKQRQATLHDLNNERRQELIELEKVLSGQGFSFEGAGDNRIISNLDNIQGKTKEVEEKFKRYIELQQSLLPQASQEWWNLQNTISSITSSMEDLLKQHRELARQDYIKKMNEAYDEQQKRLSALESIQERIVAIIRKRGEEEKKALDEAYNKDMEQLDERHNKRKEQYTEELDEFRKLIQGKLDALNDQFEEEDYLEQLNKEKEEANRLQAEIDVLSLDDSLTARNKTIELRKQLATQNEKIAKLQQDRERDLLTQSLEDQLKDKEEQIGELEDIADEQYENDKKRYEEDYRINKEYLERKYSDEKVYAEAREMIMEAQADKTGKMFQDMYNSFADFEDKFGKGMGILGDIIKNDFIGQLDLAKQAIEEMDYLSSNLRSKVDVDYKPSDEEIGYTSPRGGNSSSGGDDQSYKNTPIYKKYGYYESMDASDLSTTFTNAMKLFDETGEENYLEIMEAANRFANLKRGKGFIVDAIKSLENRGWKNPGYKFGGKVTGTGTSLVDWHGTQSSPEWILNDSQFKKVLQTAVLSVINIPRMQSPSLVGGSGMNLQIEKLIHIEGNVTEDLIPRIKDAGNDIVETLKNLNKGGIFRPARR